MKITKADLVAKILDLLNRGYVRFERDEKEGVVGSIQKELAKLAGTKVSEKELKYFFSFPELKGKKTKSREGMAFELSDEDEVDNKNSTNEVNTQYDANAHVSSINEDREDDRVARVVDNVNERQIEHMDSVNDLLNQDSTPRVIGGTSFDDFR